jgi:hypothetical protein
MEAFAIVEQQDAMGAEARGEINVVQNKNVQVARPVYAAGQHFQYPDLVTQVEVIRRFVQQANGRVLGEQGGDFDAPSFAT